MSYFLFPWLERAEAGKFLSWNMSSALLSLVILFLTYSLIIDAFFFLILSRVLANAEETSVPEISDIFSGLLGFVGTSY